MSITEVCIKRPVLAWMMMAVVVLFGIIALQKIGVAQFPDVDQPNVTISVSWPGASPIAIESEVLEPIESAIAQVEGVQETDSNARQGSARVTAVFDMSKNVDIALQDIQAKVNAIARDLPSDLQPIEFSKSNPDDSPIITVGISGPVSRQVLSDAGTALTEQLQHITGVGSIDVQGHVNRNVRIWLDEKKMAEKKVAVTDIISAVAKQHVQIPGGTLISGGRQLSVRLLGEALKLDDLKALVVSRTTTGLVHLSDVAVIEDGFADINSFARLNGQPVQALGILKQPGSNAIQVAKDVRAAIVDLQKRMGNVQLTILSDTTIFIQESVQEMELELGLALVLTAFVCWLFLGSLSSTLNVILAIPMSLLGTVGVNYFLGYTLNTFTLLGLSLAVGLVVDDAVMVMENIYRHAEMGKNRVQASADGTKEITFAALAATAAVIAIFLPVVFMNGMIGRFFLQFGVTLSIAVTLSYFEAITLAPARCSQILNVSKENRGFVGRNVDKGFAALERFYGRMLGRTLRWPSVVLLLALALMGGSVFLALKLPTELIPSQDQSMLSVNLTTASGSSLDASMPLVQQAETWIMQQPEVEETLTRFSTTGGSFNLVLVDPKKRTASVKDMMDRIRTKLGKIAGLKVSVRDPSQSSFGASKGSPIQFTVRGPEWDTLVKTAADVQAKLEASGVAADVATDYVVGAPEVQITPDRRRAADLGVNIIDLGTTIEDLVGGATIGKFTADDGLRVDIRAQLLSTQRTRPEDIGELLVRTASGATVPMKLLVAEQEMPVVQSITRIDRERAITITGNPAPGHAQKEGLDLVQQLGADLPQGYSVVLGGQSTQLQDTTSSLLFALGIGILVAYMVLGSQFNSFLHPVTVLTILPLAVSGAFVGLYLIKASLNIFSMIGLLLLMGIVKKNSIMLVEYANHIRETDDCDALTGMSKAGPIRLRPILMTTVATMMSAVPAVLGLGPGSETRGPMGAAVLGGLTVSTVLSLLVVPAFYVVADRVRTRLFGKRAVIHLNSDSDDGHGSPPADAPAKEVPPADAPVEAH